MNKHIKQLIAKGENQQLDFKFEISDSKKLAKTFSAFANTDGGILLIGVKDNGAIAGVRTDEELHMLEAAAHLYCKPKVEYHFKNWQIDGKWIIEVVVPKSKNLPHYAMNHNKEWLAYIRSEDQNHLANTVRLKAWEISNRKEGMLLRYAKPEKILFEHLENNEFISLNRFKKIARLSQNEAEEIIANLMVLDILEMHFTEKHTQYRLRIKQYKKPL